MDQLTSFSIAFDNREERIHEAILTGKKSIIVPEIQHFIGGHDITGDSTNWINECVSDYYGISVISKKNN